MKKQSRLFAVDPSLRCSGWALFHIQKAELLGVGKIKSSGTERPLAHRLDDIQQKILSVYKELELSEHDVLLCEAPTTMRDPRAAIKVEQVRGIFEALGRSIGMSVPGRINPRTVQSEIIGLRGRQVPRTMVKAAAVSVVSRAYGSSLARLGFDSSEPQLKRNQDIVDAILLGNLGVVRIQSANLAGLALEDVFQGARQTRRVGYV